MRFESQCHFEEAFFGPRLTASRSARPTSVPPASNSKSMREPARLSLPVISIADINVLKKLLRDSEAARDEAAKARTHTSV